MKKSFSILELLVVVAAVAILFAMSAPRLFFINRFILQNEVDQLFTTFSFLQQRGIAGNQEQKLFIDVKNQTYYYNKTDDEKIIHKLPDVVKFGFLHDALGPPSTPNKKITSAVSFKKNDDQINVVTFSYDGKVNPGTIYMIDKDQNNMMAVTFPISQVSYIRKYKYDGGRWVCLK